MRFRNPLSVFIVWHPNYTEGKKIAAALYSILCRDSLKPLARSMGIPTYFRNVKAKNTSHPIAIDFNESEYTAIIILLDDNLISDSDFLEYVDTIFDECNASLNTRRIYPIALSMSAFQIPSKISTINFVNASQVADIVSHIKGNILHELCRLLLNTKKELNDLILQEIPPPIKLFISHSKHDDSKTDAIAFRNFINSETPLKTFFDINDIAFGSNFAEEIKKAVHQSALVAFQSDSYADREWCRIEVLEAKSAGCPVVIVNAVQNKEQRTFPYLGNYPSIRFKGNFQEIANLTLEQVLFNLFTKRFIDALTDLYQLKSKGILTSSPELFNFIQLKKIGLNEEENFGLVIYPDPPIGSEELQILNDFNSDYLFITPLTLPSISKIK